TSIKLNYGSLYSVVESLQKHGLIAARETSREGRRPERTVYEITPAGRVEFEDWLAELLSTPARDFTSLAAGLSLMAGLPPDGGPNTRAGPHAARPRRIRTIGASVPPPPDLGVPTCPRTRPRPSRPSTSSRRTKGAAAHHRSAPSTASPSR